VIIKVKDITPMADYVVVVSGRSNTHVKAVTERVVEGLKKKKGIVFLHQEGIRAWRWVLLDYGALIVHIFYQPMREFYDIEGLWADAPRVSASPHGNEKFLNARNSRPTVKRNSM